MSDKSGSGSRPVHPSGPGPTGRLVASGTIGSTAVRRGFELPDRRRATTGKGTEPLPDTGRAPADQTYAVVVLEPEHMGSELAELMLRRRPPGFPVRVEGG